MYETDCCDLKLASLQMRGYKVDAGNKELVLWGATDLGPCQASAVHATYVVRGMFNVSQSLGDENGKSLLQTVKIE